MTFEVYSTLIIGVTVMNVEGKREGEAKKENTALQIPTTMYDFIKLRHFNLYTLN